MKALTDYLTWFKPHTPLEEVERQLASAQIGRLEAALMRESWEGYERTLRGRITRLVAERAKLRKENGQ